MLACPADRLSTLEAEAWAWPQTVALKAASACQLAPDPSEAFLNLGHQRQHLLTPTRGIRPKLGKRVDHDSPPSTQESMRRKAEGCQFQNELPHKVSVRPRRQYSSRSSDHSDTSAMQALI